MDLGLLEKVRIQGKSPICVISIIFNIILFYTSKSLIH